MDLSAIYVHADDLFDGDDHAKYVSLDVGMTLHIVDIRFVANQLSLEKIVCEVD